jgi:quinohemoprotein amine dehydrogenase
MISRSSSRLTRFIPVSMVCVATWLSLVRIAASAEPAPGLQILRNSCAGCHIQSSPDHFARISEIRKTPEGWLMTIFRMQHVHAVQITDPDRDTLVRYLADTQGLAPSETTAARYALERRPNVQDMLLPGDLQVMCARCHSAARVALQRRDADDWLKHVHWHLAQWPTIEYQQNSRDRLWWQTATTEVPGQLGKLFPFHSQAWEDWKTKPRADLAGTWLVRGHEPGRGDYWGTALITRSDEGEYRASYTLDSASGEHMTGSSKAIVYTGFEWRGTASLSSREIREVYALSEDGNTLSGRWFEAQHSEIGSDWAAVRAGLTAQIVSMSPSAVRVGSATRVTLYGAKLEGAVSFGPGSRTKVISRQPQTVIVEVLVDPTAATGYRTVTVGSVRNEHSFAVFNRVDRLEVAPGFGIARLGGGKTDAVAAQFEAVGFIEVPAAEGKTESVRLGCLPVTWSVEPYNEDARVAQDPKFAGNIDSTGRFLPAGAGPNPQRKFSGNNAGNLSILANLSEDDSKVTGKAHLIVTVQRWNTPPIY